MSVSITPATGGYEHAVQSATTADSRTRADAVAPADAVKAAGRQVDAGSGTSAEQGAGSEDELQAAMQLVNEHLQASHRSLQFSRDDGSGYVVIKVMDTEKNEVIRQIPSEELLALARHLREGDEGYLVHAQV
ncbi:flagellar protein FlaG [Plasticicumulans acidivorans]|uniref:Flagellar protein FlaG n=1 Tax=Plasticicumulans acidivorans TaxID=886464 RepID=A0A317MWV6_9GAMM|nr:flagellar protein FlaG [Plasticicumulans acidivorans]PWV63291.1 flagellar protein FlaG [Plasticicumulans acidivorans]